MKERYFRYISIVLVLTFFLTLFNVFVSFEHILFEFFTVVRDFPHSDLLIECNYLLLLSLLLVLYRKWREEKEKRKKSEDTLISLHRAVENMQIGVTITDHNGVIGYVNPAEAEMHGYSVQDLIGREARIFGPPELRNYGTQPVPTRFRRETSNMRRDGSIFPVQLMSDAVITPEGNVFAVVTTCEDISERKRMEKEREKLIGDLEEMLVLVSRSQREWQETFDAITDVIFMSDVDFTVTRINRVAEIMLGMPIKEILGRKCYELFHRSAAPPDECAGCVSMRTRRAIVVDELHQKLNIFLSIKVIPRFDNDGNLIGLIHVMRDITDRKKLEDQLAHAKKLEAVGQLAGGIAHDFNNILTAIISSGKLMELKIERETHLKAYIGQILDVSERGVELIRGLLSFSGKREFYPIPQDLNALIRDAGHLFLRVVSDNIQLNFKLADYPLTAIADRTEIERVLINLITNARDAIQTGGVITISTRKIELEKRYNAHLKPGKYAMIDISDTGSGMDESVTGRIFDPFFTTKEVGKGTGLGLSLAYGAIRKHNGSIEVHSASGAGTVMRVFIPLAASEPEGRATAHKDSFPDDGRRNGEVT